MKIKIKESANKKMPVIEAYDGWDEIERDYENELWVCEYCLEAIESHEGRQHYTEMDVDEYDEEESKCDWCEDYGFDKLYKIGR